MANNHHNESKPPTLPNTAKPIVKLDYTLYAQYLDDADLTQAQKQDFLETLWTIIVGFVDLGFEVQPDNNGADQNEPNLSDNILDSHGGANLLNQFKPATTIAQHKERQ